MDAPDIEDNMLDLLGLRLPDNAARRSITVFWSIDANVNI